MTRSRFFCITGLVTLFLMTQAASADIIKVTFTGQIGINIDPLEYAFVAGDPFSYVLTYDSSQPNLGTVPGIGLYGEYDTTITVQASGGPVTYGGPVSWNPSCGCEYDPLTVYHDVQVTVNPIGNVVVDLVGAAGTVGFGLVDYSDTALASASLADVNWQALFALSQQSSANLPSTDQPKIALRGSNAADVVEGRIDTVSVQDIPVPEPGTISILLLGLMILLPAVSHQKTGFPFWRRAHSIERGVRNVSLVNIERIAKGLKTPLSQLFGRL